MTIFTKSRTNQQKYFARELEATLIIKLSRKHFEANLGYDLRGSIGFSEAWIRTITETEKFIYAWQKLPSVIAYYKSKVNQWKTKGLNHLGFKWKYFYDTATECKKITLNCLLSPATLGDNYLSKINEAILYVVQNRGECTGLIKVSHTYWADSLLSLLVLKLYIWKVYLEPRVTLRVRKPTGRNLGGGANACGRTPL